MVLIPAGFAQVNYRFGGSGLPHGAEITMGLGVAGFGGSPDAAASAMQSNFATTIMTRISNNVVLQETSVKYGPTLTGPTGVDTANATGGLAANAASSAVTYLVRKTTDLGGRAGRGRFYLPGVLEGDVGSDGAIAAGPLAALQGEVDEFYDLCIADLLLPVVLHGAGSPINDPTPIEALVVDATVATQRRRQRR